MLRGARADSLLRKDGRRSEALAAYLDLGRLGDVRVGDRPSALVAHQARVRLFADAGRPADAEAEARALGDAVDAGTYRLDRGAYEYYLQESERFVRRPRNPRAEALAAAAERLATLTAGSGAAPQRVTALEQGRVFLLVRQGQAAAVLASGAYTRLHLRDFPTDRNVMWGLDWSPDDRHVVVLAREFPTGRCELWMYPATGGARVSQQLPVEMLGLSIRADSTMATVRIEKRPQVWVWRTSCRGKAACRR